MSHVLINPNWHVVLIHFPLCLLLVGIAIELLTIVLRRPPLRTAGRWILLFGALSAVVVAFSGIYALDDLVYRSQRPQASQASERPWRDLVNDARLYGGPAIGDASNAHADQQRTDEGWRMLKRHAWLEGSGTALVVILLVCATALPGRPRHGLIVPLALGLILWGAWFSGETVYRDATATQLKGADEPRPAPPTQRGLLWLGILLLFDGHGVKSGQAFYRFRPASDAPAMVPK